MLKTFTLACLTLLLHSHQGEGLSEALVPQVVFESAVGVTRSVVLEGFESKSLEEHDAVLVRFEELGTTASTFKPERACEVSLAGGVGFVRGDLLGGEGELFDLRLIGGSRLKLGIEEIESLRLPARVPTDWTQPVIAGEQGDRLYRTRGLGLDRIDGTLEELSAEGVTMDTALGSKRFPWNEVAALFVEVFDDEVVAQEGERIVVDLVDGSRLPGVFKRLSADGVELTTRGGRGLRLPPEVVSEVFRVDAGLSFLSDLEPLDSLSTSPFGDDLGMRWPVRRDRSTTGGPLSAGGRVWTRGLGVHAPSRLEFDLGGAWTGLRGSVAIDDEVIHLPARGSVRFLIHGDDQLLWQSEVLHGGDQPISFPQLDLAGVQKLTLEVDMAEELHIGDRADWLRLILVR